MCKLIIMTKAPLVEDPIKQTELFNKLLTDLARTEKDGLGIAYLDSSGAIQSRRWSASKGFHGLEVDGPRDKSDPVVPVPAAGFVLLHGRTATSPKSLENAHPHCGNDADGGAYALIHNGVVSMEFKDKQPIGPISSSCDSELILAAWIYGGMERVSETVRGYYAFGLIVAGKERSFLHVVKDRKANLYVGETDDSGFIFATTPELVGMAGGNKYARMIDLAHLTFSDTGEMIGMEEIPAPKENPLSLLGAYGWSHHGSRWGSDYSAISPPSYGWRKKQKKRDKIPISEIHDIEEIDRRIAKEQWKIERLQKFLQRQKERITAEHNQSVIAKSASFSETHGRPLSEDSQEALAQAEYEAKVQEYINAHQPNPS